MSSTTHDPNRDKSPDEIEREVEAARARLTLTLDEIRERMSPGQMLDQALDYAKSSGGADFTRNLGRSVRDNPLPIALMTAGLGWLMAADRLGPRRPREHHDDHLSGRRMARGAYTGGYEPDARDTGHDLGREMGRGYPGADDLENYPSAARYGEDRDRAFGRQDSMRREQGQWRHDADRDDTGPGIGQRVGSAASSAYGAVASGAGSVASGVGTVASGVGSGVGTVASGVKGAASTVASAVGSVASGAASVAASAYDAVSGAASSVGSGYDMARDSASHLAHGTRDRLSDFGSGASGYASDLTHRAGRLQSSVQSRMSQVIEEQPLILGALGFAVGAILGAALPRTQAENRVFGSTADRLKSQAASMAQEGFETARTTARETFQEAASALDERGFSTRNAGEALSAVADTVRSAIDPNRKDEQDSSGPQAGASGSPGSSAGPQAKPSQAGPSGQPSQSGQVGGSQPASPSAAPSSPTPSATGNPVPGGTAGRAGNRDAGGSSATTRTPS